jgi:hypothetical protein
MIMPHRVIDEHIQALREQHEELQAQSKELERKLAELKERRAALGVVDDKRILAGADVLKDKARPA